MRGESASSHARISRLCPTAAHACLPGMSLGLAGSPSRSTPSAMAPDDTMMSSRDLARCLSSSASRSKWGRGKLGGVLEGGGEPLEVGAVKAAGGVGERVGADLPPHATCALERGPACELLVCHGGSALSRLGAKVRLSTALGNAVRSGLATVPRARRPLGAPRPFY